MQATSMYNSTLACPIQIVAYTRRSAYFIFDAIPVTRFPVESLQAYFEKYGEITDSVIMVEGTNRRPRLATLSLEQCFFNIGHTYLIICFSDN